MDSELADTLPEVSTENFDPILIAPPVMFTELQVRLPLVSTANLLPISMLPFFIVKVPSLRFQLVLPLSDVRDPPEILAALIVPVVM